MLEEKYFPAEMKAVFGLLDCIPKTYTRIPGKKPCFVAKNDQAAENIENIIYIQRKYEK